MPVVISLLRGVNVGGHNRIAMEALRDLYASLGFLDVRTYVQSGNVLFRTRKTDLPRLAKQIEDGIEKRFGLRPKVILRTPSDLRTTVAANPFAARTGMDPKKIAVVFLDAAPGKDEIAKARSIQAEPEELHIEGRELYIYFANGMARPKLSPALLDKTLKTTGTARNWNTVTKLLAIAAEMDVEDTKRTTKA